MSPNELRYGKNMENKIFFVKILDELGINKRYLGYYLLIEMMEIMVNNEKRIKSFSSEIYPLIALKYGKTSCTVERNIRSLIEKCWNRDLMEKLNTYYPEGIKPPCQTFIYLVKNYITNKIS